MARFLLAVLLALSMVPLGGFGSAFAMPADNLVESSAEAAAAEPFNDQAPEGEQPQEISIQLADGRAIEATVSRDNSTVSADLIQKASQDESANASEMLSLLGTATEREDNFPGNDKSSMATTGQAHVLAIQCDFQDVKFDQGDTTEALQGLLTGGAQGAYQGDYPYESLQAFYQRSSYGKLTIDGKAVSYTAKGNRSDYEGHMTELIIEALEGLDSQIDYTKYDGDGDGYIDAVYLHFAGSDGVQWMGTWWSVTYNYAQQGDQALFDGMGINKLVSLHEPSNTQAAFQTIIHETGHVLGLPDYYPFSRTTGANGLDGIDTFDTMYNNMGDHNGYSKWLLGWISPQKLTYVVVNEQGVTVKTSTGLQTYSASEGAQLDLAAYLGNDVSDGGNIVFVTTQDAGMLTDGYLLQYDTYASNTSVNWGIEDKQLPSGFRVYRVMGHLDKNGDIEKSNFSGGSRHNNFIELVDPDGPSYHLSGTNSVAGVNGQEYGCMYYAGMSVTPQSDNATTNFYESVSLGFTGICINFLESGQAGGKVRVSYDGSQKPQLEDFAFTYSTDNGTNGMVGSGKEIILEGSSDFQFSRSAVEAVGLYIDGSLVQGASPSLRMEGRKLYLGIALPQSLIDDAQKLEVKIPQGLFVIGNRDGQAVYSQEIVVEIPLAKMTKIQDEGTYDNVYLRSNNGRVSNSILCSDGKVRSFLVDAQGLRMMESSSDSLGTATVESVLDTTDFASGDCGPLSAYDMGDGHLAVLCKTASNLYAWWVNQATGAVDASSAFSGIHPSITYDSLAIGNCLYISGTPTALLEPDYSAKTVNVSYVYLVPEEGSRADVAMTRAGDGQVAFAGSDNDGFKSWNIVVVDDVSANAFCKAHASATQGEALNAGVTLSELSTSAGSKARSFAISGYVGFRDIKRISGGWYALMGFSMLGNNLQPDQSSYLLKLDEKGAVQKTVKLEFMSPSSLKQGNTTKYMGIYNRLAVSSSGVAAVSRTTSTYSGANVSNIETQFIGSSMESKGYFMSMGDQAGLWMGDRWYTTDRKTSLYYGAAGAPDTSISYVDPTRIIHYDYTASLADGVPGGNTPGGGTTPGGDEESGTKPVEDKKSEGDTKPADDAKPEGEAKPADDAKPEGETNPADKDKSEGDTKPEVQTKTDDEKKSDGAGHQESSSSNSDSKSDNTSGAVDAGTEAADQQSTSQAVFEAKTSPNTGDSLPVGGLALCALASAGMCFALRRICCR